MCAETVQARLRPREIELAIGRLDEQKGDGDLDKCCFNQFVNQVDFADAATALKVLGELIYSMSVRVGLLFILFGIFDVFNGFANLGLSPGGPGGGPPRGRPPLRG